MIPCEKCITLAICKSYLTERKNSYKDFILLEEYNYETILDLFEKCVLLRDYIPVHIKNSPRGLLNWDRIQKEKLSDLTKGEWKMRIVSLFDFYDSSLLQR